MNFKEIHIGILGMGEAGMSAARWLYNQGADLVCMDDRPPEEWQRDFLSWCKQSGIGNICVSRLRKLPKDLDLLVVSPGVPPHHRVVSYAREKGVAVVGELYLAACFWKGPLVGITGTNGKTTTTLLTAHLLNEAGIPVIKAGNISPPLFDLLHLDNGKTCGVLEISSFQLEYFPDVPVLDLARPVFKVAVCLNVAPDHIDRHGSIEKYKKVKERLFSFQGNDSFGVLGPGAEDFEVKARTVFLKDIRIDKREGPILVIPVDGKKMRLDVSRWTLRGKHNIENLASAAVSASALGVAAQQIEMALSDFRAPCHRMEEFGVFDGVIYIDDSKATNLHAVTTGLRALPDQHVVLIAGGRAKGEDLSDFGRIVLSLKNGGGPRIKGVILVGEAAKEMALGFEGFLQNICVIHGLNGDKVMEEAARKARAMAEAGDLVVLSPACASFDMFSSYKKRGMAFRKAVLKVCSQKQ